MADALSRKVHEMLMAFLSICQPDLRQQIINHIAEDEMYVQIKDKLQQQNIERKYEDINWKEKNFLLIRIEFIFQMWKT